MRWMRLRLRWRWKMKNWFGSLLNNRERHRELAVATVAHPSLLRYRWENNHERSDIHLRVESDGSGVLIVNASRIMQLNQSATLMARLALENSNERDAIREIRRKFNVTADIASTDYAQFKLLLPDVIQSNGPCPIHDLDLILAPPFSSRPSAPYRMDLAVTYRCNNDCSHCYNARPRNYPEISTDDWKNILDRLWSIGIPHIVFTGGEPTLRNDLPELIAHAHQIGQITGLNSNGRRLSDLKYLDTLVNAGLDHVQITVESHDPHIHETMVHSPSAWGQTIAGLQNALDSPLFVMTNTTMLTNNAPSLEKTLSFLAELGVPTVGLNALIFSGHGTTVGTGLDEEELKPLLDLATRMTEQANQRLIWYTPTEYCHFDPMELDLGVKGCTAALYNMCVEPNGDVIPCQSYYQPLGNLLHNSWDSIWNHSLANDLREHRYVSEKCHGCILLSECGGGCPLRSVQEN
jgi:radical SAM protein with 4Fe4S-binding SPASM domain